MNWSTKTQQKIMYWKANRFVRGAPNTENLFCFLKVYEVHPFQNKSKAQSVS